MLIPILLIFFSSQALSDSKCCFTKQHLDNHEPKTFNKNNSFLISPLKNDPSIIVVKGRVVDERCVPISNITIEAWQADQQGFFNYTPLRNVDKKYFKKASNFAGSGTSATNNRGEFTFVTRYYKKYPLMNMRVKHYKENILETKIRFNDKVKDIGEFDNLMYLKSNNDNPVIIGNTYYYQIVVPQTNKYKRI
jgi:protocatechuate 3,4-dioxygenase beta subunit